MFQINSFAVWLLFTFICVMENTWDLTAKVEFRISSAKDKDGIFPLTKKVLTYLEYPCQIAYKHIAYKYKTEAWYTYILYFERETKIHV